MASRDFRTRPGLNPLSGSPGLTWVGRWEGSSTSLPGELRLGPPPVPSHSVSWVLAVGARGGGDSEIPGASRGKQAAGEWQPGRDRWH